MKIKLNQDSKNYTKITFNKDAKASKFDGKTLELAYQEPSSDYEFAVFLRSIIRQAKSYKLEKISVDLKELSKLSGKGEDEIFKTFVYESLIANYEFDKYKTKKDAVFFVKELNLTKTASSQDRSVLKKVSTIAQYTNMLRDVANTPANDMHIPDFIKKVKQDAKSLPVKVKVLDAKELKKQKMGAILAVGGGAKHKPAVLVLEYKPEKSKGFEKALVGKGVVYDTGGLGLKPAEYMLGMHMDMTGAAIAAYSLLAYVALGNKENLVAVVPLVENAIGKDSYRQGDIIKTRAGKTIEVKHTDAEGRLILVDAISYAQDTYKVKKLIDIATLTGAAMVALGVYSSAVFTNSKDELEKLQSVAEKVNQRLWELPIYPEHGKDLESKVADLSNIGTGASARYGGASTAAAFLKEFVDEKVSWIHVDIAPRMEATPRDNLAAGSTGEPLYSLVEYLANE